jgi:hypothetical protein
LRDDATLTLSIEKLLSMIESPVAFAKRFNEENGTYTAVTQWSATLGTAIAGGVLVWRTALPQRSESDQTARDGKTAHVGDGAEAGTGDDAQRDASGKKQPKRFYGSVTLDPDKAGLQVAAIAKEILFELTRPNGSTLKITLEIEGAAALGYPEDVVDVVRANLRDLKLDVSKVGFEEK